MAFQDSSPLLDQPEALRQRAAETGYLFFRNLIPAHEVTALEQRLTELADECGLFDDAVVDEHGRIDSERMARYYAVAYRLRAVHALPKHANILHTYGLLFGRRAVPHARTVLRTIPHGSSQIWPPHQDMPNLATHDEAWNTWLPVGECPQALGTVSIAPGSHRLGPAATRRLADNGLVQDEHPAGLEWISDDLNPGDVVLFNALTFHRGQPNRLPGRLRLSLDNYIQPHDTAFVRGAFDLHYGDYGDLNREMAWADVYADWPADDALKFFWRDLPLQIVDDPSVPVQR